MEKIIISVINIIVGIMFFIKLSSVFIKKDKTYKLLYGLEKYAFLGICHTWDSYSGDDKIKCKNNAHEWWMAIGALFYSNVIMYFCIGWYWNNIQEIISKDIFNIDWWEVKIN